MAMKPEVKVKMAINKMVKKYKGKVTNPIMEGMGQNGTHDKLVCINGFFLSIEAKAGNNKPSPLQCSYGKEVYEAGGIAIVVNEKNLEDLEEVLKALVSGELNMWPENPIHQSAIEAGGCPVPFEMFRRVAYWAMWRPFLNNEKRRVLGGYPKFDITPKPLKEGGDEA